MKDSKLYVLGRDAGYDEYDGVTVLADSASRALYIVESNYGHEGEWACNEFAFVEGIVSDSFNAG